jgi:putative aldouronate transport system permease protein
MGDIQTFAYSNIQPNKKSRTFLQEIVENRLVYFMALPGLIILFLFCYLPFMYIVVAFKDFNIVDGIFNSPWVGLDNFKFFFSTGRKAFQITFNTVYLNSLFIGANLILQVGFAVLINELKNKFFKRITQSIFFFPYFLSWVVIGEIIYGLFSSDVGAVNSILNSIGLESISWYRQPGYWRTILVGANIWRFTGYGTIIYLAVISGFDPAIYEAGVVDGMSRLQAIRYITLPMLKPTMFLLVLFSIGRIFFGDFGMVYAIVRDIGPLLEKTDVIDTYVFRALRRSGDFSMSTAIGIFQSFLGFILIFFTNKLAKRLNESYRLF